MNQRGGVRLVPGLAVRAGQTIAGRYRVEELIGAGASGVVLSARSLHLREPVTLKILASYTDGQEDLMERRMKKARLALQLHSSHVARILDIGLTEEGMPYVATEALEGRTLDAELAERGPLTVEEAVRWVLEACEGLAEAHAAGLIHGDLKPQNIFLALPKKPKRSRGAPAPSESDEPAAETRVLKILDFGTTSPLDAIGDQSASAFFGSPAFLAPEQIQDPASVDARADIWALGVLLYDMIAGSLPFEADTLSGVIVAVVYDAPALLTDAPYELARIVQRCLEKDPAQRPQDVKALALALAPFAGPEGERLSERVRIMLDTAPVSSETGPVGPEPRDADGSISPVAVSLEPEGRDGARDSDEPLLLVTKRTRAERAAEPTRPSLRVMARRRSRVRAAAFGILGTAAAVALASWGALGSSSLGARGDATESSPSPAQPAPEPTTGSPGPLDVPADPNAATAIRATTVDALPAAPDEGRAGEAAVEPEPSFAAKSPDAITPTPLAVTPTPLAVARSLPLQRAALPQPPAVLPAPRVTTPAALPNAAPATAPNPRTHALPPTPLPPPRIEKRSTTPLRLPAGLPTSREGLEPPRSGASGAARGRADETSLRKLLTDRN